MRVTGSRAEAHREVSQSRSETSRREPLVDAGAEDLRAAVEHPAVALALVDGIARASYKSINSPVFESRLYRVCLLQQPSIGGGSMYVGTVAPVLLAVILNASPLGYANS